MPINSVNQEQEFGYISSEFFTIEYRNKSGTWINIPGAQDISFSGTSSPTRDVVPANGAVSKRVGRVRVPEVSLNCYYIPNDLAWRYLREAQRNRTAVRFRVSWDADKVFESSNKDSGNSGGKVTVAATTGNVTFDAGNSSATGVTNDPKLTVKRDAIGRGQLIVTMDATPKHYMISEVPETVDSSNFIKAVDVTTWAAPVTARAVSAVRFKLYNPAPHRIEFTAAVVQGSDMDMGAESEMMTNLILAPRRSLPDPTIITTGL